MVPRILTSHSTFLEYIYIFFIAFLVKKKSLFISVDDIVVSYAELYEFATMRIKIFSWYVEEIVP